MPYFRGITAPASLKLAEGATKADATAVDFRGITAPASLKLHTPML